MAQPDKPAKAAIGHVVMAAGAGQSLVEESRYHGAPAVADDSSEPETETAQSQDEIAMVRRATEVLGIHHVAQWMRSEIPSLGNQTPYLLIRTKSGRDQVERALMKIEHGVY